MLLASGVGGEGNCVAVDQNGAVDFAGKMEPRCSISQFIRRMAFTIYGAAFFLEGRQTQVRIAILSNLQ